MILSRIANNIIAESQTKIFDKMLAMDVSFYNARHSTEFIARQAFISQSAGNALNTLVTALGRDILTTLGLVFAMFQQDPRLASIAVLIMPLAIVGVRRLGQSRPKQVMMTEFYGFAAILESLQETAQGIRVVKSFTLEPFMRERQVKAIQTFEGAANKLSRVQSRSSPLLETLAGVAIAMVVVYGGYRVIYNGAQPGNFFAFITALLLATEPAKRVARLHVDMSSSLLGVGMLYEFLDERTPEAEPADMPELKITQGRVEFDDVEFSYRPGELVLNKLNFVAEQGQTTALVGRSGGGKTTAMSMILRFYEPTAGKIVIDGQDISAFSRQLAAQPDRLCRAGHLPVQGLDPRKYRLRTAGRERRGHRRRRQGRVRPRLHHGFRARLQFAGGRAGHAALRRPAPAHLHRPRLPQGRAADPARRGDLGAGHRIGARRPGGAEDIVRRTHHLGHRPPPQHRGQRRAHLRDRRRQGGGIRAAGRTSGARTACTPCCTGRNSTAAS